MQISRLSVLKRLILFVSEASENCHQNLYRTVRRQAHKEALLKFINLDASQDDVWDDRDDHDPDRVNDET